MKTEDVPAPDRPNKRSKRARPQKTATREPAAPPEPPASVTIGDPDPGGKAGDYSELKIYAWQWRDAHDAPNPMGNVYPIGRTPYWFELGGLTEKDGKYRVAIKSRIINAEGRVMYDGGQFNVVELAVDPAHPHAAQHADSAQIPVVGEFHLELQLRDEATGELVTHTERVHIR